MTPWSIWRASGFELCPWSSRPIRVLGLLLDHAATTGSGTKLWGTGTILTVIEIGHELGVGEASLPLVLDLEKAGLVTAEPVMSSKTGAPPEAYDQQIRATGLGAQLFARLSHSGLPD